MVDSYRLACGRGKIVNGNIASSSLHTRNLIDDQQYSVYKAQLLLEIQRIDDLSDLIPRNAFLNHVRHFEDVVFGHIIVYDFWRGKGQPSVNRLQFRDLEAQLIIIPARNSDDMTFRDSLGLA